MALTPVSSEPRELIPAGLLEVPTTHRSLSPGRGIAGRFCRPLEEAAVRT